MGRRLIPAVFKSLGPDPFWALARAFYRRIETDDRIRGLFPADFEEPIRNQAEFLIQYFGGPTDYSDRKGHPRLRGRHMQWSIGPRERDAWLDSMRGALDDVGIPEAERAVMWEYFTSTAHFLMNCPAAPSH